MIWHIFRKDLRRLWPFVAGLAALHLLLAVIHVALGDFPPEHSVLSRLSDFLGGLSTLLIFFAAVLVVQLDPIPDDRQDWLVRPIRRRDLLAAKLQFMVLTVQAPMFAADLLQGLASGFPPGQALAAAGWWNLYQFVGLSLPSLALATLARTVGQTLGVAFVIIAAVAALAYGPILIGDGLGPFTYLAPTPGLSGTLAAWVLRYLLLLAGVAAILRLQYFRRRTLRARVLLAVFALLLAASQVLLPPRTALAMQNWLAPEQSVTLAFAPEAGKDLSRRRDEPIFSTQPVWFSLPLKAEGLAPDLMLVSEGAQVVVTAPDGKSLTYVYSYQDAVLHAQGRTTYYQPLSVPRAFLRAHAGQKMRVDFIFTLGILRPRPMQRMPADGGDLWLAEGAHCASRVDAQEPRVEISCRQAGNVHQRAIAMLMDGNKPLRWSVRHLPSDAPYSNGADMITRFNLSLPFDGLENRGAETPAVAMMMAQPVAHVVRQISIPDVVLDDWSVDGARNGDAR